MKELFRLTARQAVDLLRSGQVSPEELIQAAAERIAATDDKINALPTLCLERARERAARLRQVPLADRPPWHLHGLPIAVKDLQDVAGVRTTYGSRIFAEHVPRRSDISVQRLEQNGALVIAKSNTPEFGSGGNTFNEVFGSTLNPWDTSKSAGGSSGGSAAALATGQVWLATGTDLGGSLRIPASFCSVLGLRPSPGRVAFGPDITPWQSLSVAGPMARNLGDLALMLDAQAGVHPRDPRSLPWPERMFLRAVDQPAAPARVAFSPDLGLAPVDREVRELCAQAARRFEGLGAVVEEAAPDLSGSHAIFSTLRAARYVAAYAQHLRDHRHLLKPEVNSNIEQGLTLSAAEIAGAEKARGQLYQRTVEFFETFDLLLCPAVMSPPFAVNIRYLEEMDGVALESYFSWLVLTYAISLTACPALSLPCGFTSAGLPVGLQMVGPPRGEAALLAAAAGFEQISGLASQTPLDPRPPA